MTLKPLVSRVFPDLLDSRGPSVETSIISSDPPLTIGSKPSRNPFSPVRPESWADMPGYPEPGCRFWSDVEKGVSSRDQDEQPVSVGKEMFVVDNDEKGSGHV
jgi:hypothetical protein